VDDAHAAEVAGEIAMAAALDYLKAEPELRSFPARRFVEFDRVRTFGRGAFAFTGGDGATGLHLLQQRIAAALRKVGLGQIVDDSYTPHMTILHDSRRIAEHPINPIRWWVREFVLVHSHLGQTRYDILARFPLR